MERKIRIYSSLQEESHNIQSLSKKTGLQFSIQNTKALTFSQKSNNDFPPLYNQPIEYADNIGFLGIIFNKKLLCQEHIKTFWVNCQQVPNLMRSVRRQ